MEQTPSCKYYRLLADEYIEGELTDAEARDFEAHIAACPECRKELEELRALKEMIAESDEEIPEGLHGRIMSAVNSEIKPNSQNRRVFRRAAISAACAVICLSLAIIFMIMPLWQEGAGGSGLPADSLASTELSAGNASPVETDESGDPQSTSPTATDSESPEDNLPEYIVTDAEKLEQETSPASSEEPEMTFNAAESPAPEVTVIPETAKPEVEAPQTEAPLTEAPVQEATEAPAAEPDGNGDTDVTHPITANTSAPSSHDRFDVLTESSAAPGGEEITFALLIVSGLLAVASFIAFLISLSSVRNIPAKKNKEEEE